MNNVDPIIKYLSEEMHHEEARSFEKDLESNPALKEEFEEISAAFQLIKDQLQKRDEVSFREKLLDVMEHSNSKLQGQTIRHRPKWYFLVPLAASLAILLAVYLMNRGTDRILSRFYDPTNDPVVLAFNQGTRGDTESGINLYQRGLYKETREKMSELMVQDPENKIALLYYLLASMEVDQPEDALQKVLDFQINHDHQLGQSIIWYTTLAFIKLDRLEEAATHLLPLAEHPGPYQTDARRLQKVLLK